MTTPIFVLGEALMDCIAQPDGQLRPLMGGSPFNMARAAALRGASAAYLNPLSTDLFGQGLAQLLQKDGVQLQGGTSRLPTSLAVVQVTHGQPSYGFYREGIADRDYTVDGIVALLRQQQTPGILHTGSLLLIPPEHHKVLAILKAARALGWTISLDINLRPKVAHDLTEYVQALGEVIALTDWLKASDEDLETMGFANVAIAESPRLVRELRQSRSGAAPNTLSRVALTFGDEGAYLDIEGQSHSLPVPRITVADTVGAGDTFWGNTLADWALQPHDDAARVAQTLENAMKAAAINCTRQGCQPPTWAEVQAF
ncbi:PfkB family carbohydrate kinase [uncultured Limnohabitans sp.]|uniref:PfkB family carbohydrate kinase n=1 Tax=uncultured Limnohabitans sp. TaxID=768543 RepID=UPI0026388EE6|nr:PfkB family carbohydrate kinase [uncultured Limnohabitans sp.]